MANIQIIQGNFEKKLKLQASGQVSPRQLKTIIMIRLTSIVICLLPLSLLEPYWAKTKMMTRQKVHLGLLN